MSAALKCSCIILESVDVHAESLCEGVGCLVCDDHLCVQHSVLQWQAASLLTAYGASRGRLPRTVWLYVLFAV
jgi:hypothetical protein